MNKTDEILKAIEKVRDLLSEYDMPHQEKNSLVNMINDIDYAIQDLSEKSEWKQTQVGEM